jgi:trimethylamine:corrinoid methyltransferase-like protein
MMLIQTGWLAAAQQLVRGVSFDLFDVAAESIQRQGPGGNYLMDDLTLELLRSDEFFSDDLFDFSGGYEEGPSLLERAHARAEALVAAYEPGVPGRVQENLDRWFEAECAAVGGPTS